MGEDVDEDRQRYTTRLQAGKDLTAMTKLIVDGKEIDVPPEYTLLQACEAAGAEIPRFCYHERLSIAGNCRMCLVEVKGGPKPVASCAWAVRDCRPGPKGEPPEILTRSPMVKKAREGVMEFLLINHPLDCPICDQGGECDLQDQAMGYGVDTRRREVMRVLPRINEAVNEEWISDKTRHVVDGLRTQRLDRPYIREAGKLRAATWPEAFAAIAAKAARTDGKRIGAIAGDLAGVEEMFALKDLLAKFGSGNLAVQGGDAFDPTLGRGSYIFNPTLVGVEQADALLIISANPRKEAAVFNARIRKRWRSGGFKVGVIGAKADLTYDYDYLGAGSETLGELAAGKHSFMDVLKNAKNPIILVGAGAASRHDGAAILAAAAKLALDVGAVKDGWSGFGVLHETAPRVGALDIGYVAGPGGLNAAQMTTFGTLDLLFLLGADEIKASDATFVVYIGTHGDRGAHRADVILPAAAYTEKSAIYVNTEGRVQMTGRAAFPPGEAREDWAIVRALSEALGKKLGYDSLAALRQAVFKAVPHLIRLDQIEAGSADQIKKLAGKGGTTEKAPFKPLVEDFD